VHGVVQGVNFRNAAVREASTRRLTGRVWNRDDGCVELIAEGDEASLADLERWLHDGPRFARVDAAERTDLDGEARYSDFAISDRPVVA
jgi:acylphosphatase